MTWIKIDRDRDGFASLSALNAIVALHKDKTPIALLCGDTYEMLSPDHDIYGWYGDIERDVDYTHYLPIPKAPEE